MVKPLTLGGGGGVQCLESNLVGIVGICNYSIYGWQRKVGVALGIFLTILNTYTDIS